MVSAPRHLPLDRIVGPFTHLLLHAELPQLPADRRAATIEFVQRRLNAIPSFTGFGIAVIAVLYRCVIVLPGGATVARFLASKPIPVLGEYPRLIRALGFAFVWERWPDTLPSGAPR